MPQTRRSFLASTAAVALTGPALAEAAHAPLDAATRESRIAWLKTRTTAFRSLDFGDDDFTDLDAFAPAIGDARIVMLGEQTHGDGTSLRAKARLVRFLHQRMGFDVLAFESSFYQLHRVWQRIRDGESARDAVRRGMLGIYSRNEQMQALFDYVGAQARADRPLELAGFDCQFSASKTQDRVADDLSALLAVQNVDPATIADWPRFRILFDKVTDMSNIGPWKPSPPERDFLLAMLDTILARLADAPGFDGAFWRRTLKSTMNYVRLVSADLTLWPEMHEGFNQRDAAMADNLVWLAREAYPQRKIVGWAASFHIFDYPAGALPDGRTTMGTHVRSVLGDAVYNIGCSGYAGRRSFVSDKDVNPPPRDSIEDLWGEAGLENALLDLRHPASGGEWLRESLVSRLLSEASDGEAAEWSRHFDAVLFLRAMEPSTWN